MFSDFIKDFFFKFIVFNLIVFEGDVDGQKIFIGFKIEIVLFLFVCDYFGMGLVSEICESVMILQFIFFDFGCKCMGIIVQLFNGCVCMYIKGVFEIVFGQCLQILCDFVKDDLVVFFIEDNKEIIIYLIEMYVICFFCIIGIVFWEFEFWFLKGFCCSDGGKDQIMFEDFFCDMFFIGMVGIQDLFCDGVFEVV